MQEPPLTSAQCHRPGRPGLGQVASDRESRRAGAKSMKKLQQKRRMYTDQSFVECKRGEPPNEVLRHISEGTVTENWLHKPKAAVMWL